MFYFRIEVNGVEWGLGVLWSESCLMGIFTAKVREIEGNVSIFDLG